MEQHFITLGWMYSGDCGCNENKKVFINPAYPKWQLWITKSGDRIDFRKIYGNSLDTVRKGSAGIRNYGEGYDYWVINDRD